MPIYKYRAKKGPEGIVEGVVEAKSEREAIEKLSSAGFVPVSIKEDDSGPREKTTTKKKSTSRIKSREITVISRELASLLRSGIPILRAIGVISEQSENPSLKDVLSHIHDAVKEGSTFSSKLIQSSL